ncbi:hypothetical protein [Aquisphaera insulae]|uniref:hypothetical protein n=1 Tax=Aquisphaera insulae TaxID=2712864 RepID=UPI0013EDFC73|nr:hypothetical protein [Aquisphaera insulae]
MDPARRGNKAAQPEAASRDERSSCRPLERTGASGKITAMKEPKTDAKARLLEEAKTMLFLFAYLSLWLGTFSMYRRLILAEYGIGYFQYGYSFIEALVLSKVIVLGRILGLGERFRDRPLIVPTLYKTMWFSLLLLTFSIAEHLIGGWFHGKTTRIIVAEVLGEGLPEILARTLVHVLALMPILAVWEIGRVLGEGRLFELFFKRRSEARTTARSQ